MAACRSCRTELRSDEIGCARCSPPIDESVFDRITAHPHWRAAQTHDVGSRRGNGTVLFGVLILGGLLALLPSAQSAAADNGDNSGLQFIAIGGAIGVLVTLFGVWLKKRPLHRHAGVVLGTAFHVTRSQKHGTTTHHYVHLAMRGARRSFSIDAKMLETMYPGRTVIAFERWGYLDLVWDVDVGGGIAPAVLAAPDPLAPAPPPDGAAREDAVRAAVAKLAALDPAAVLRARTTPFALPLGAYKAAYPSLFVCAMMLFGALYARGLEPDDTVVDLEAYATRGRILVIVLLSIAGACALAAVWIVARVRRARLTPMLVVPLERREIRVSDSLHPRVVVVDAAGTVTEHGATNGITFVLHEPMVLGLRDGEIVSARDLPSTTS